MTKPDLPVPGEVFSYPYLWHWQDQRGETEGRKSRPSCLALAVQNGRGETVLFIAPITSRRPDPQRAAIAVPLLEARRAGLDTDIPLWVIVDEVNTDIWERSYYLEDRIPLGRFSEAFTRQILRRQRLELARNRHMVSRR
ncbi:MAG: hypothetical protein H3C51_03580 [Rubellimicrobium sp.]|nr:hypothetical protein [Rubellimicrobium sp.]